MSCLYFAEFAFETKLQLKKKKVLASLLEMIAECEMGKDWESFNSEEWSIYYFGNDCYNTYNTCNIKFILYIKFLLYRYNYRYEMYNSTYCVICIIIPHLSATTIKQNGEKDGTCFKSREI